MNVLNGTDAAAAAEAAAAAASFAATTLAALRAWMAPFGFAGGAWFLVALAITPLLYSLQQALEILLLVVRLGREGAVSATIVGVLLGCTEVALGVAAEHAGPAWADTVAAARARLGDWRVVGVLGVFVSVARAVATVVARTQRRTHDKTE